MGSLRDQRPGAWSPPTTWRLVITSRSRGALEELVTEGLIDGIVCQLKSGKEADLYVVEHGPYHYVAKVYRDRRFRSFKNDAGYREGRNVRNSRTRRALQKNSRFGQQQAEEAWRLSEVEALRQLEASGASVPRVLAHHDRVLVMELICDEKGELAPQLAQVPFSRVGAREMYDKILQQVVILLLNDLVHGDLSPYNILVRDNEPVVIDFPQCVSAAHNQQAAKLLERDILAISQHLGLIDPAIRKLGEQSWQIWAEYEAGTLDRDFRPDEEREKPIAVGDLDSLVGFVKEAQEEGELERRAAAGDEDARALLRAADKRARKRARAQAALEEEKREAERREAEKKRGGDKKRGGGDKKRGGDKQRGDDSAREGGPGRGGDGGGKRRRRRRSGGGGGGEGGGKRGGGEGGGKRGGDGGKRGGGEGGKRGGGKRGGGDGGQREGGGGGGEGGGKRRRRRRRKPRSGSSGGAAN